MSNNHSAHPFVSSSANEATSPAQNHNAIQSPTPTKSTSQPPTASVSVLLMGEMSSKSKAACAAEKRKRAEPADDPENNPKRQRPFTGYLPTELWTQIFHNLGYMDLRRVSQVSTTCRAIVRHANFNEQMFLNGPEKFSSIPPHNTANGDKSPVEVNPLLNHITVKKQYNVVAAKLNMPLHDRCSDSCQLRQLHPLTKTAPMAVFLRTCEERNQFVTKPAVTKVQIVNCRGDPISGVIEDPSGVKLDTLIAVYGQAEKFRCMFTHGLRPQALCFRRPEFSVVKMKKNGVLRLKDTGSHDWYNYRSELKGTHYWHEKFVGE